MTRPVRHGWEPTPWWLQLFGIPAQRRRVELLVGRHATGEPVWVGRWEYRQ